MIGSKNLLWRLLRKNVSAMQMLGFSLANLIGLCIVLVAIQFYIDVRPIFADEDSFFHKEYMVMSKKVGEFGSLLGDKPQFSDGEIKDLEQQDWCKKVGKFTTCSYSVYASVGLGDGRPTLRTHMFFESIPNDFIDISLKEWQFDPSIDDTIPVVISKDYLSLYNFGFATAQGMPQISETMAGAIPLDFLIFGNGKERSFKGRIVGFSNRLNTIVVPESFMNWANANFGSGESQPVSRVIMEVSKPGDTHINEYAEAHGYEIAGNKGDSGKANYFLTVIISIVIAVGIVISALSFFVLLLSIHLLLQKNTKKLQNLLHLGYSVRDVAMPYVKMVVGINVFVYIGAIILLFVSRSHYVPMLSAFAVPVGNILLSASVGVILIFAISIGNIIAIFKKIGGLWHIR